MQSTRHDPSLAALQAGAGLPGHVLDVVVLSADSGLLATLRAASGPEHALWHAPSADVAVDLLVGGRCSILIADLGTLRGDTAALLERLHAQFPELILMATGRREEEATVASLVSDGHIYRFLHKPISPARANLFLAAATRRYNELHRSEPIVLTTVKTIAARSNLALLAAAVAALLALILGLVLWLRHVEPDAATPPRQIGSLTSEEQIADALGRAQIALATGRLTQPRGDNALEYFRGVLQLQPHNSDAQAGIERVAAALEARVLAALQARNPAQGATALTALQRAIPDHPRLDALREQLLTLSRSARRIPASSPAVAASSRLTQSGSAPATIDKSPQRERVKKSGVDRAAPGTLKSAALAPAAEEIAAIARLRSTGALLEPADNNAYDRFVSLRERYPESPEVRAEQQQLAFALLERARTPLAAGNLDTAAALLSRVETLVPGMTATRDLQTRLAAAQQQRNFMSNVVDAAALKREREVPAIYPRDAERNAIQGWVDVEFTILPDGTTRDFAIRAAQPAGVFDQAALSSIGKWRFAPLTKNGVPVAQRARLRVRFQLRD